MFIALKLYRVFTGVKSPIGFMEGYRDSPQDGSNLKLTIDIRLQSIAYHELKRAAEFYEAQSGSIIIIDPKKGDILALSNFPTFNPTNRENLKDLSTFLPTQNKTFRNYRLE